MAQTKEDISKFEFEAKDDYESDWDLHRGYIQDFDAYEAMLMGIVYDNVSNKINTSKITDSYATTLAKERADRVIAKLPDGQIESAGAADVGKAMFMDILRQKWIYPNANAQRPFLNLWQFYSSIYGYMPMFYDWTTSLTGYIGPDCWLWNPRNLVPQGGKVSIEDSDYITALTWVSKKKIEIIIDSAKAGDGWDTEALQELVDRSEKTSGNDAVQDSLIARTRLPGVLKKGICLATRYEAGDDGKWVTFAPDNAFVKVRELDNPHKNGRIPFVIKYSQPLFDSFYGMGDFQRAKPVQFARDGLTNFYFANLKRNLAPGIIVNANGVLKHTLDVTKDNPILMETIPNSIRPMVTNTAGLSTYQGVQSNLTGSLLSLFGTQNASIPGSDSLNPSQGKTPSAIGMYSDKEASRDGAESRHMASALNQLHEGWFSLIANIGTEDIPVNLFREDIDDIRRAGGGDVMQLFKGKFAPDKTMTSGTLTVDPASLKGVEYRFTTDPDSTLKVSKQNQLAQLETIMGGLGKFQNIFKDDPRVDVEWGPILQAYNNLTDIPGASEFVKYTPGPSPQEIQAKQAADAQSSQTQVASPGGQVHETADLVKLYVATQDEGIKTQIMEAMGFTPTPVQPQPTVSGSGVFHDPVIAQTADQINKM